MSANEISKVFNTSHGIIIKKLHGRGIDTRDMIEAQYNYNGKEMNEDLSNKKLLHDLHWNQGLSCKDIGAMYGVDQSTIRNHMKRLGVKTKNNSESKIGLMSGEKHHNWRGGITPLNMLLREFFHINQAPIVAKRDNYTCQMCGKTHTILHVHHKNHFSDIISEIRNEHPDLQPNNIDDKQKLYDIIIHDQRFLDNDNLITLCKECHVKTHSIKIR